MMDGMKGLFRVEYGGYRHEYVYLVCISKDEARLNQRASLDNPESKVFNCDESDESYDDSDELSEMHIAHYIIRDVETI